MLNPYDISDEDLWKMWSDLWEAQNIGVEFDKETCDMLRELIKIAMYGKSK